MRRKALSLLLALGIVLVIGGGLLLAVKHEPRFYAHATMAPGSERVERSKLCFKKLFALGNRFVDGQGKWSYEFSEEEFNSFFEEEFVRLGDAEALAKVGVTAPRLRFEKDRIRLAFRYGNGFWSTVLSYDLRVWLAPKDVNVLVVEFLNRQIGGLPIASQTMLNEIKELSRNRNLDVTWFRSDDHNPVAVIRLPSNRSRNFAQLLNIDVSPGHLTISGQCNDPNLQAMLTP
jgi:hypothetical protein